MSESVRIVRCPRCDRPYSVVPPQTEAEAQASHDAEHHVSADQSKE